MNCKLNYLYEKFPDNPEFAQHLEQIELSIWKTFKDEKFPTFEYEGKRYYSLSPKMSKERKKQMKILQSLRDKYNSPNLFLTKRLYPFDYDLITIRIGTIVSSQKELFDVLQKNKPKKPPEEKEAYPSIYEETYEKFLRFNSNTSNPQSSENKNINNQQKNVVYSAIFFNTNELTNKYNQVHPNLYSHHSTIEFKPQTIENLPVGENRNIRIIGRLTTDKVDVLIVDNPLSKNKFPHITLSTAEGVKPFESNSEIEKNQNKIKPLNDIIVGKVGYFDGKNEIVNDEKFDENYNLNKIKSGVEELFDSNPELANIGTAEQYSQYLDTIFPDSKVRDIVYKGGSENIDYVKDFDKIEKETSGSYYPDFSRKGLFFTNKKELAEKYGKVKSFIIDLSKASEYTTGDESSKIDVIESGKYGDKSRIIYWKKPKDKTLQKFTDLAEYIVFEPEQIHILGNKKDVERFQNFVNQNQFQQKQSNQKQPSDSKLNAKIKTLLEAIGVRVDYIENSRFKDTGALGVADMLAKVAYVSMNKSRIDTLPEEAAHFFVDYIEQIKDPLFNSMMYDIEKYDIFMETYQQYKNTYTKSDGSPDMYKIRKEAIGKMIAKIIVDRNNVNESQGLIDRFTRWLDKVLDKFKTQLAKIGLINEVAVENYFELAASNILEGKYQGEFNANNNYYNQQLLTESQRKNIANLKQSDSRWNKYSDEDIQRFIDSIFPDSKVKDIVYHGSKNKLQENKFDLSKARFEKAIFFFKNRINALKWESENPIKIQKKDLKNIINLNKDLNLEDDSIENNIFYTLAGAQNISDLLNLPNSELILEDFNKIGGVELYLEKSSEEIKKILDKYTSGKTNNVINAILNIRNPKKESNLDYIKLSKEGEKIKDIFREASKNNDGVILENITEYTSSKELAEKNFKTKTVTFNANFGIQTDELYSLNTDTQYAVFEPEQIYILNSDKAISDMEKFVGGEDNNFVQFLKGRLDGSKLSQEIEGKLEANKDRLIELLGNSMYSEKLKDVVYKELLQNSFDATKIAESKGLIDRGKIDIEIDEKERIITFKDNGIGMSSDIVQKAFFTIGGTYKGDNVDNKLKSGGLGLAKMAFIFGSEKLILETIHNGIKTTVDATSQEIRNDNFKIKTESTNELNGTKVSVKIPENYIDSKGENRMIDFPRFIDSELNYSFLKNPLIGNVDVNYSIVNRENIYRKEEKIKTNLGNIPENYILFSSAKTNFADMDIYIDSKNITKGTFFDTKHNILSSGLFQFETQFKTPQDERIPLNIIIDIKPTVDATNNQYPFNNQRENFKPTIKEDIKALSSYISLLWKSIELETMKNSFGKIKNIEAVDVKNVDKAIIESNKNITKEFTSLSNSEIILKSVKKFNDENKEAIIKDGGLVTKKINLSKKDIDAESEKTYSSSFKANRDIVIDKSTNLGLDSNKPIIHNNTNMKIDEEATKFLTEISSIMIEYKKSIIDFYGEDYSDNISNQLWGVSIDKTYGGVNVNPSILNMLTINPFYNFPTNPKIDAVNYIAVAIDHLIIHELNHNFVRNEGADFTGRFLSTYSEVHSLPNHFELISKIKLSVKNNLELIKKLNYEYQQSENVESGFEGNKLEQNNQTRTNNGNEALFENDTRRDERTKNNDTGSGEKFGEILKSIVNNNINTNFTNNDEYEDNVSCFI